MSSIRKIVAFCWEPWESLELATLGIAGKKKATRANLAGE